MVDPVMAADGTTYERRAIQQWLEQHDTSPLTGAKLDHLHLSPNILVRGLCRKVAEARVR